jgi:sec-independent protein translocase protein TatA
MIGSLGFQELILIFVVALIVFGPRRLPDIGRSIGKALGEFKRATNDLKATLEEEVRIEEGRTIEPKATPRVPESLPASEAEPGLIEPRQ